MFYFYKKYLIFVFSKESENKQKRPPGCDFQEKDFFQNFTRSLV